jgi:hypothetical protein
MRINVFLLAEIWIDSFFVVFSLNFNRSFVCDLEFKGMKNKIITARYSFKVTNFHILLSNQIDRT